MIDLVKISKNRKYPGRIKDGIKLAIKNKINTKINKAFSLINLKDFKINFSQKEINKINKNNLKTFFYEMNYNGVYLKTKKLNLIKKIIDVKEYGFKPNIKKLQIVFSTNPWDIATISMRGINSCMKWNHVNSKTLAGSIIDPCAGVIYLTDGTKTKYGSTMLARSIVRLIKDDKQQYKLLLEEIYFSDCDVVDNLADSYQIFDLFTKNLKIKSGKNIPIISEYVPVNNTIPLTKEVSKLPEEYRSYRDSSIQYTNEIVDLSTIFSKNKPKKKVVKSVSSRRKLPVKQTRHA
jgi:hypothetical protein